MGLSNNQGGEIILRSNQVCNLTEVVLSPMSTLEENMDQVEAAVFLGLLQSQLTSFEPELLKELKFNTEEEGLLGVSLTGLMDDEELMRGPHGLAWLKEYAHECAARWSKVLGIKCPTAITCVKPSGTVSKLAGCAPGIHPQFSKYYLSNIAVPVGTPMARFLEDQKVPIRHRDDNNVIFSFPMAAPDGAITADNLTALRHLELWNMVNQHWCDHNASCTIYVGEDEWAGVQEWCHENINEIAGVTFLSRFDGIGTAYMPLEKITSEDYAIASVEFPVIDWKEYSRYDDHRNTSSQELACTGGVCVLNL